MTTRTTRRTRRTRGPLQRRRLLDQAEVALEMCAPTTWALTSLREALEELRALGDEVDSQRAQTTQGRNHGQ